MNLDYQEIARDIVSSETTIPAAQLYVVWFCKTLQNWKALVSTDVVHGKYWEVTHNGNSHETYVDTYHKEYNVTIPYE